jgi:hypothetical protein
MNNSQIIQRLDQIEALTRQLRELLTSDEETFVVHGQGTWRPDMLSLLWPRVEHLRGVRTLFELTAERAPTVVTFPELVAESGLRSRQQANEHARLSRVAHELFNQKTWPIENWQDSRTGVMHYRMDETVAQWWIQVVEDVGPRSTPTVTAKALPANRVNALAGRWVAQDGDEIIAVGDSPENVAAQVRRSARTAAVWRIPSSSAEADADLVA